MVESSVTVDAPVAAVRRFNRFYTPLIGLLDQGYLHSSYSLTDVRVLYELAHCADITAGQLARATRLDPGYLSRILRRFHQRGLIAKHPVPHDGRQSLLQLTEQGRQAFAPLDLRSQQEIATLLAPLTPADQTRLSAAMDTIAALLGARTEPRVSYLLRPPHAGDLGWVVQRHGALYAQEYGWDETFEALVARVVATYVEQHQPRKERCWIAERNGENVGSVFLVHKSDTVAQLRLLLVEPGARGLRIGRRLVDECIHFAGAVGYQQITLWTNSVLVAARRIYEAAGFRLMHEEPHHSFGHDLVGETWELDL